jgi:hypothetical protein
MRNGNDDFKYGIILYAHGWQEMSPRPIHTCSRHTGRAAGQGEHSELPVSDPRRFGVTKD